MFLIVFTCGIVKLNLTSEDHSECKKELSVIFETIKQLHVVLLSMHKTFLLSKSTEQTCQLYTLFGLYCVEFSVVVTINLKFIST
jgi:hypothetical protein